MLTCFQYICLDLTGVRFSRLYLFSIIFIHSRRDKFSNMMPTVSPNHVLHPPSAQSHISLAHLCTTLPKHSHTNTVTLWLTSKLLPEVLTTVAPGPHWHLVAPNVNVPKEPRRNFLSDTKDKRFAHPASAAPHTAFVLPHPADVSRPEKQKEKL